MTKSCPKCSYPIELMLEWDAWFCPLCNDWTEWALCEETAEIFFKRPKNPLHKPRTDIMADEE